MGKRLLGLCPASGSLWSGGVAGRMELELYIREIDIKRRKYKVL